MKLSEIAPELRKYVDLDLVAVQCGKYYNLYNQDAQLAEELFDFTTFKQGSNIVSGFPRFSFNKYDHLLKSKGLKYAFVSQEPGLDDDGNISRIVEVSTEKDILGRRFKKSRAPSNRQKHDDIFVAILNGYNPLTGEVFDKSSPWMHPIIQNDLRDFIEGKSSRLADQKTKSEVEQFKDHEINQNPQKRAKIEDKSPKIAKQETKPEITQTKDHNITQNQENKPKEDTTATSGNEFSRVSCESCGRIIPDKRIEAMPNTKLCVECADSDRSGQKNRRVTDTFGSREDFIRDRYSWKRTN